jgi:disulfide bond formation protein DsbB
MTLAWLMPPKAGPPAAWAIFALALATIAGAWTFQAFGIRPCDLCLAQRYAYYAGAPLAAVTAVAATRAPAALVRIGFLLLAVIFAANAILAAYHAGVEFRLWHGPTACTGSITAADIADLLDQLDKVKVVRCDEVQIRVAGLSLAVWDVLISAAIALYAALASRAPPTTPEAP